MALQQLSEEQIQNWSREEKDRWWLANVFRGDMAQLTLRSAITGFLLGGILTATNLYVGAKTGVSLGVGLTSVILAFALFKILSRMGMAQDFTILENNCMQSIATAAGYMTAPLISSLTAYMWMTNRIIPWHQMLLWNVVLSVMGVLVAFPMKRRFINDEQQPFPEGRACGVVLDTLYTGKSQIGMIQARALAVAGLIFAFMQFCAGEAYMKLVWAWAFGRDKYFWFNEQLDAVYYRFATRVPNDFWDIPRIKGVDIRELGLRPTLDLGLLGVGGLMGIKTTTSLLVGMIINFAVLAPWMIQRGEIKGATQADGSVIYGFSRIVPQWSIWWAVSMMVVASMIALFAKPKVIFGAFSGIFGKKREGQDVLRHIELPLWVSFAGLPVCAAIAAWMGAAWFDVKWYLVLLSLPLVFALSLIATNAMALTSWTPTGSLSKITQFTFGMIDKTNPATNLMTAGITAEVASNSANLLSDIKPGYMLGAKPRQQAIGHIIGIFAGAIASTPLFYALFFQPRGNVTADQAAQGGRRLIEEAAAAGSNLPPAATDVSQGLQPFMVTEQFSFPSAQQWKGVADIIASGFKGLSESMQWSIGIAIIAAVILELTRIRTKGKFWLSPVGIGLGVVLPPNGTMCMWIGSLIFWLLHQRYHKKEGTRGHTLWVLAAEPICAGIIAGAALTAIGDRLLDAFVIPQIYGTSSGH